MIRFGCPRCKAVLEAPDHKAGVKFSCPKCQQRLQIPQPPATPPITPAHKKTVLGSLFTSPEPNQPKAVAGNAPASPGASSNALSPSPSGNGMIKVACPECGRTIMLGPHELSLIIECAGCNKRFVPADRLIAPVEPRQPPSDMLTSQASKNSGLGTASFLIGFIVWGLDILIFIVVFFLTARFHRDKDFAAMNIGIIGGRMMYTCVNLLSIPACLLGVGLSLVALTTQRNHNHIYTWIGLVINALAVLILLGLYVCGIVFS